MRRILCLAVVIQIAFAVPAARGAQLAYDAPDVVAARKARDGASVEGLQKIVAQAQHDADASKSFDAYLRVALFSVWLCEAAEDRGQEALLKPAAEAGVAAAERAVALNPQSSDAHQLLGDLLGQLIPHVFGGGMKYGKRSTDEMDKALELDPKNVNAYVSRAISYYYSPETFGGSKEKAFELLNKAAGIDAKADSPHLWLAMFYLDTNRRDDALREINLARNANPDRAFTNYIYSQINAPAKKDSDKKTATPPAKKPGAERQAGGRV
jgi:tetratricopeptide (TPR) repeat protein